MAVSNTDDHLRNHGFIMTDKGLTLSPMYDVNPDIYGNNLSLNVSENDSSISFELACNVSDYFDLSHGEAKDYIDSSTQIIDLQWKNIAKNYGISRSSIQMMEPAFNMNFKK